MKSKRKNIKYSSHFRLLYSELSCSLDSQQFSSLLCFDGERRVLIFSHDFCLNCYGEIAVQVVGNKRIRSIKLWCDLLVENHTDTQEVETSDDDSIGDGTVTKWQMSLGFWEMSWCSFRMETIGLGTRMKPVERMMDMKKGRIIRGCTMSWTEGWEEEEKRENRLLLFVFFRRPFCSGFDPEYLLPLWMYERVCYTG